MSWAPQVSTINDDPGVFNGNSLRYATEAEARQSAQWVMMRWTAVTGYRAAYSDDPVNRVIHKGVEYVVYTRSFWIDKDGKERPI